MKAKLIKKNSLSATVEPKPAAQPVRPAQKPQLNPRAAFAALFTKK
jgi:hypothetical protein